MAEEQGLFSQAGDFLGNMWEGMSPVDKAAIGLSPIPILGDIVGLGADLWNMYKNPEERTWTNAGLTAAGLLPWVPPAASKRVAELFVHNMPNDLPMFYRGGKGGQVYEGARTVATAAKEATKQALSPKGQAKWRKERVSNVLQKVMKDKIGELHVARKALDDAVASGDEKAIKQARREYGAIARKIEGQKSQSYLFGEQYGNQVGPLKVAEKGTHVASGNFNVTDLKAMSREFTDASDKELELLMRGISQRQGIPEGVGKLVMKDAKSSVAAGDLTGVVNAAGSFPQVKKVFASLPVKKPFGSYGKFKEALMEGASKAQKAKIAKTGTLPRLKKAFHGNKDLTEATTVEDFSRALRKSGIKMPATQINHAFSKLEKVGFKDNAALVKALDDKGIEIYNRAKVLKNGDPVMITNSMKSPAYELGGVNVMTILRPDGSTLSFVNDKNDLMRVNAPHGGSMVTVSTPVEINLTKKPGKVEARHRKSAATERMNTKERAAKAVQKAYGINPFDVPDSPTMNIAQRSSARAIADVDVKPTLRDYGNAAGVGAYIAGSGAYRGGLMGYKRHQEDE